MGLNGLNSKVRVCTVGCMILDYSYDPDIIFSGDKALVILDVDQDVNVMIGQLEMSLCRGSELFCSPDFAISRCSFDVNLGPLSLQTTLQMMQ
jgi:hypothetical protein